MTTCLQILDDTSSRRSTSCIDDPYATECYNRHFSVFARESGLKSRQSSSHRQLTRAQVCGSPHSELYLLRIRSKSRQGVIERKELLSRIVRVCVAMVWATGLYSPETCQDDSLFFLFPPGRHQWYYSFDAHR